MTQESESVVVPRVPTPELWCVHVLGPDEVHPAPDRATAQLWAAQWTIWNQRRNPTPHPFDPITSWVVGIWPHDADSHATGLAASVKGNTWPVDPLAAAPSTSVREEVDPDLLKRLSDRLAMATPGPWSVQDGCSWRRIGTQFHDGNVLCPTNHPRDNHPDLAAADGKLYANLMLIVEVVNALPTLLAALVPSSDEGKRR